MRAILIVCLCILFVTSCGPTAKHNRAERKLARLVKKNPDLVKNDTTWIDTALAVPVIRDTFNTEITPDLWPIDSLTAHFDGKIDSTFLDSLNQGFKAIAEHVGDFDTTFVSKGKKGSKKTTIHVKKEGKKLEVKVDVEPDSVDFKAPVAVKKISPNAVLTWYEVIILNIGKTFGAVGLCLLLLLIAYIFYRFLKHISR